MEKGRLSKAYKILLTVSIAIMLVACMPISIFGTQSFAKDANNGYNLATEDIWDREAAAFNNELMQELLAKLTGNRGASIEELKTMIETSPDNEYGSQIVKTPTINANAGKIQPGLEADTYEGGLVITLKGKDFRVTSLTLDDDDNVVATLYQKESDSGTVAWHNNENQTSTHAEPSSMYGTSDLRNNSLLGNNGYLKKFEGNNTVFASSYLVQPKKISYQRYQTYSTRSTSTDIYNMTNEALSDVGNFFDTFDYYNNGGVEGSAQQLAKREKYISWGEDYVWLPSATEACSRRYGDGVDNDTIWGLSDTHLAKIEHRGGVWLRSGYFQGDMVCLTSQHNSENVGLTWTKGLISNKYYTLRPAMHLNLTNAMQNLTEPDLWDEQKGEFNKDLVNKLLANLRGTAGATLSDVESMIAESSDNEYGSQIVKSPQINQNAEQVTPGTEEQGMQIKLKGKIWRITSLTIDDNGNVVATLLLKNPFASGNHNSSLNNKPTSAIPSNTYAYSYMRKEWFEDYFADFIDNSFAERYFVQPDYIQYQRKQSAHNRLTPATNSLPNDALGENGYTEFNYSPSYDYHNKFVYSHWGSDFIWLPSLTETGSTTLTDSIWGMSLPHISFSGSTHSWLRSAAANNYNYAIRLGSDGLAQDTMVNVGAGIRPAMHLNLTNAINGPENNENDIWDSENNEFKEDKIAELLGDFVGEPTATLADVAKLLETDGVIDAGSRLVKAPVLNSNSDNEDLGLIIRIKERAWKITSLTIDDNGNIVATLMLCNPEKVEQFNVHSNQGGKSAEPSNMYGSSTIRNQTLMGSGGFLENFLGDNTDFAGKYLVKPKYIAYQREQSAKNRPTRPRGSNLINEALNDVGNFNGGSNYDYYNNGGASGTEAQQLKREKYISWGEDYVWLPSITELGAFCVTDSIWQMPQAHSVPRSIGLYTWFRSGSDGSAQNVWRLLDRTDTQESLLATNVMALGGMIQPAMHLNLSAIAATEAAEPSEVDWQYSQDNGEAQYPEGKGDSSNNPLDLTYNAKEWKFEIDTNALPAGVRLDTNTAADLAGFTNGYRHNLLTDASGDSVIEVTVRLAPKIGTVFRDPDGSPSAQQYREFILYVRIAKSDLAYTWDMDSGKVPKLNIDGLPSDAVTYTITDSEGATVTESQFLPGREYTVTAQLKEEWAKNYGFGTNKSDSTSTTFMTDRIQIAEPTIKGQGSLEYDAKAHTFAFNNFDTRYMEMTANSDSLTQTAAGTYSVTFRLTDEGVEWADGGTGDKTVTFTITTKKIANPTLASGSYTYNGSEQTVRLNNYLSAWMTMSGDNKGTDAGDYKVTFSLNDPDNTEWAEGGIGDFDLTWKIGKKSINESWSRPAGEVPKLNNLGNLPSDAVTYIIQDEFGNTVTKDELKPGKTYTVTAELKEEYSKNHGFGTELSVSTSTEFATDSIKLDEPTIEGDKSVVFDNLEHEFVLSGFEDEYMEMSGDSLIQTNAGEYSITISLKEGATWSNGNKDDKTLTFSITVRKIAKPTRGTQTLIYTGVEQTFTAQGYDEDWMHANGITGINAGNYTATFELKDGTNTVWADDNRTDPFTLNWVIDKAKFDLSGVTWGASEFVFNGANQKIELEGLPNGLSAKLGSNEKKDVGTYQASVMEFAVEDTDNYVVPIKTNKGSYIGDFEWTKGWSISKLVIPSEWSYMPYEDANGNEYRLPIINGDWGNLLTGQIKYTYYRIEEGGSDTKLDSVDNIIFVLGEETWYKVKAEVKAEFAKNYALDGDMAEKQFAVGANTNAVEVWLAQSEFIFDGEQKVVTLINDSGLGADAFIITYYDSKDQPLSGAPTNAGTYRIEVALADELTDDYYLVDGSLEFVIAPKQIAEPTSADNTYVYNGEEQTFAVNGFDEFWMTAKDGLSGINAGSYTAVYGLADPNNTVWVGGGTADIEIDWKIDRAKLSLEGVAWSYDINKPFVYEWLDGAAVEHEVRLNGLDKYLTDKAIYVNNTSSIVGVKTASVTFDIDADNYEFDDLAALDALRNQVWEVKARIFNLPNVSDSLVFDNTEHNLADFAGLDSGWENYFDVNYTLDGDPSFNDPMAKNAGNYNVRFAIKSEHKNGNTYYVEWAGNDKLPKTTKVAIEQREIVVDAWQDGKPPVPSIDSADADYYQVVYTFEGQIISLDDIDQYYGKTLKAEVRLADSMSAENVAIVAADGVETFADFIIFDSADEPYTVELPISLNVEVEYDRDRMRFDWTEFGGAVEDAQYITIGLPTDGFGVGTHNVTVRIRSTANAQWSDGTRDELQLTVEIIKGKIEVNWDNATPPALIFGDETDELIEYVSYDSNGEIATIFTKGETYRTVASIRAEFAANYGFWVDGEYLETVEKEFTVPSTVANPPTIAEPKLEFNGAEQTFELDGFDPEYMTMTGELTFTNAGKYSVTIELKNDAIWADGTIGDITLEFEITKKKIAVPTVGASLTFNGEDQTFTPNGLDGAWVTSGGDLNGTNAGTYNATFALKDSKNTEWADGSIGEVVLDWQIDKAQISATWDKNGDIPTLSGLPSGLPNDAIIYTYQDADGKVVAEDKLEKGKDYTVKAELKDEYKANYGFGAEMSYELKSDKFAFGGLGGNGDNDDTNGGIADNLPLWQIIVTAAGLLLGLIFFAMSIANGVKTKKLKGETADKRLGHAQSYAALPLLGAISGEAFLGMSDKVWTILAAAAAAFCLVGLTMMLVTGRQKVTAAQKLDKAEREELARVEREERLEREEKARIEREEAARAERQQRENEMKMLFMMMSKRGGGGNGASEDGPIVYHTAAAPVQDVKEIVTQVVAALMPGMQAQLPPINMANYEKMEKLVDQQMQVLDRQTRIIESMKGEREQGKDDNDEGG